MILRSKLIHDGMSKDNILETYLCYVDFQLCEILLLFAKIGRAFYRYTDQISMGG
ncbi:hypothetical protein VIBNISFn118_1160012 [Vibrio nigripulchritudo SFn118]|nr:hypothetical protein VIBNISFn118_1160012 [Vibrio nigripulchritudo SFn118]